MITRFEQLNNDYSSYLDFSKIHGDLLKDPQTHPMSDLSKGFLFLGLILCIPKAYVRDFSFEVSKMSGLAGHHCMDRLEVWLMIVFIGLPLPMM